MDEKARIEKIKQKLDKLKEEKNRCEGKQKALLEQLEKEFKITSFEEARKEIPLIEQDIRNLEQEVEERLSGIEEAFQ